MSVYLHFEVLKQKYGIARHWVDLQVLCWKGFLQVIFLYDDIKDQQGNYWMVSQK